MSGCWGLMTNTNERRCREFALMFCHKEQRRGHIDELLESSEKSGEDYLYSSIIHTDQHKNI